MIKLTQQLPRLLPGIALFMAVPLTGAAQDKPNIVFIISDDHRWDCIGAAGNPNISTPNIDRLANEGVYLKEATILNPQCMPSRAVLLTGKASHANGWYSNQTARQDLRNPDGFKDYHCLPEALADEGYVTAMIGKWHLPMLPWNVGFQQIGTWMIGGAGPYKGAGLAEGKSTERKKNDEFTQVAFGNSARKIVKEHADAGSTAPLFLWLSFTAPHGPFQPNPEAAVKPYADKSVDDVLPPTFEGDITRGDGAKWKDYVAAITSVDVEVGKLLTTLDENGMSSNTVIVFLGDNGFMMGNRGLYGKTVPWEDSIRVPFIVWGPGVIKGKGVSEAVASSLDLPPTFMRLAGAAPPADWQGRDLSPVLADGAAHSTTWSISQAPDYNNWKFPGIAYRAVRTKDSKLIVWHEKTGKAPEFYDISKDRQEKVNLYADEKAQPKVKELTQVLETWMQKTGDDWEMKGELLQFEGSDAGERQRKGRGTRGNQSQDEAE